MHVERRQQLDECMQKLGVHLKNLNLLQTALTHCSASADCYERLEFLGDSVLGFVITNLLFERFPEMVEGELSRLRASLVSETSLAAIAKDLDLAAFIIVGSSEARQQTSVKDSILADVVESVLGAVLLEKGLEAVSQLVASWFGQRMLDNANLQTTKDPKTLLQELLQSQGRALPIYHLVKTTGKAHRQTFYIECEIEGVRGRTRGSEKNKRKAEQQAAQAMLDKLGDSSGGEGL